VVRIASLSLCLFSTCLLSTANAPGIGVDCYRTWDALYVGTIPVVEDFGKKGRDGWIDQTLADLPIVTIGSFKNLTPAFLEQEYNRIIQNPESFIFEKLTRQYWINLARSFVQDYKRQHSP
jgi:hypothetical protein